MDGKKLFEKETQCVDIPGFPPLHFGCFGFLISALPKAGWYNKRFVQIVMHTLEDCLGLTLTNKIQLKVIIWSFKISGKCLYDSPS